MPAAGRRHGVGYAVLLPPAEWWRRRRPLQCRHCEVVELHVRVVCPDPNLAGRSDGRTAVSAIICGTYEELAPAVKLDSDRTACIVLHGRGHVLPSVVRHDVG